MDIEALKAKAKAALLAQQVQQAKAPQGQQAKAPQAEDKATTKPVSLSSLLAAAKLPEPSKSAPPQSPVPVPVPPVPAPVLPAPAPSIAELAKKAVGLSTAAKAVPAPPAPEPWTRPAPNTELEARAPELVKALDALSEALHMEAPGLGQYLADIHKAVRGEPELVYILDPDRRAALYRAMIKQSGVELVYKPKANKAKAKPSAVADDDM